MGNSLKKDEAAKVNKNHMDPQEGLSSITCKIRLFGTKRKPNKLFQSVVYFIRMKNSSFLIVV